MLLPSDKIFDCFILLPKHIPKWVFRLGIRFEVLYYVTDCEVIWKMFEV